MAHARIERFWNQFREGGSRFGEMPTNREYSQAVLTSMRAAGFTREQAMHVTRQAIRDQVQHGLLGVDDVPRLPGRINQRQPQ